MYAVLIMEGKLVSDPRSSLLVDIGNSRIKYALLAEPSAELVIETCLNTHELERASHACNKLVLSSVGHAQQVTEIAAICENLGKPIQIVDTEAQKFGIHCAYENFQTMGVDRWLAILAGRKITELPLAVIHLGTANTCDFILNNNHLGLDLSRFFCDERKFDSQYSKSVWQFRLPHNA